MKPIRLYDQHGRAFTCGGNDRMIGPSRQKADRKRIELLDTDFHRNLSSMGRRVLLSIGRAIYYASGAVRGAVNDLAEHSAGIFQFESRSQDDEFRSASQTLLHRHDRMCDVAGPPNNLRTYRECLVRALYLDGDYGTIQVRGEDGRPYLQSIPGHRISSNQQRAEGGMFDGARLIDGVIVDDNNRALGYRVQTGDGTFRTGTDAAYVDVPASSMALTFVPVMPGQVRGMSILGLGAWDLQDLDDSKRFELIAQKVAASRVFQEYNEQGEAPPGTDIIAPDSSAPDNVWRETIDGGGITTYFKANTGSKIEAVEFNRPHANQQAFAAQAWREALAGAGLSVDFDLDLSKLNGGPLRLLTEKINRKHGSIQAKVVEPASRRFDFFRLGVFLELKRLPMVDDWFEFEYQPAAELTPDRGYESEVTLNEIRAGIQTRARGAAIRGECLEDVRKARFQEMSVLLDMAEKLHAKFPQFTRDEILNRLESDYDYKSRSMFPADEKQAKAVAGEGQPAPAKK